MKNKPTKKKEGKNNSNTKKQKRKEVKQIIKLQEMKIDDSLFAHYSQKKSKDSEDEKTVYNASYDKVKDTLIDLKKETDIEVASVNVDKLSGEEIDALVETNKLFEEGEVYASVMTMLQEVRMFFET